MKDRKPSVPKATKEDQTRKAVTVATGVIAGSVGAAAGVPGVGGLGSAAVSWIWKSPLEKRRQEWEESLDKCVRTLEEGHGISPDALQDEPAFITAVVLASQAAFHTHHDEKLEALRNAVINSALPNPPNQTYQELFIRWVDELTVDHLRILHLFRDPLDWFEKNGKEAPQFAIAGSLSKILEAAYPDLGKDRELYDLLVKDLAERNLFGPKNLHGMLTPPGAYSNRTTPLGDRFVDFISLPAS